MTLLDELLALLEGQTGLRASFDDLAGLSLDYPQLRVSARHAQHCSALCEHAKRTPAGYDGCNRQKYAANHLALRHRQARTGHCYLGLLDIAQPLVVAGRMLGVFYYGSVRVLEQQAAGEARIRKFCTINGLEPETPGFLAAYASVPAVKEARIPELRARLAGVARIVAELCTAWSAPVERYQLSHHSAYWGRGPQRPPLVRAVLAYVRQHFGEPCQVADLARHFRCHPDYLGRVFLRHTGQPLSVHVRQVRVERARRLLAGSSLGIGEIGARCGYPEPAQFNRVFRAATGQTPSQYRAQARAAAPPGAPEYLVTPPRKGP